MADQKEKEKEKSSHTGAKAAGILAILALLGGGGYLGLGGSAGIGNLINGGTAIEGSSTGEPDGPASTEGSGSEEKTSEEPTTVSTEATSTEKDEKAEEIRITVNEDSILCNGKELTVAELEEELLKAYEEGTKVVLKDDHAIKAVYDEVTAVLEKLRIKFSET